MSEQLPHVSAAADRLMRILTAENAALAALDFPGAVSLLPAKTEAADAFATIAAAWPDAAQVSAQLAQLAEENQSLLRHAITVQGQVIALIARAIPRALQPANPCYGARGQTAATQLPPVTLSARA